MIEIEITAQDIQAAFKGFEDFQRVQVDPTIGFPPSTEEEVIEQAKALGPEMVPGIRNLAQSVGIGEDARREFYLGVDEKLKGPIDLAPVDQVADHAAFLGLIVGLTARRIAEERKGKE